MRLIIIILLLMLSIPAFSEEIQGGVELDWPLLNQEARDQAINYYRDILFKDIKYKIDKTQFQSRKKDSNFIENETLVKKNLGQQPDRKMVGFYLLNKLLFIYGVQYFSDFYHIYYYNTLGGLEYVDIFNKHIDDYPNISYQYNKKGDLVAVYYNNSEYDQYAYLANGKFKGRWYGDRFYDKKAKIVMTRKLY